MYFPKVPSEGSETINGRRKEEGGGGEGVTKTWINSRQVCYTLPISDSLGFYRVQHGPGRNPSWGPRNPTFPPLLLERIRFPSPPPLSIYFSRRDRGLIDPCLDDRKRSDYYRRVCQINYVKLIRKFSRPPEHSSSIFSLSLFSPISFKG